MHLIGNRSSHRIHLFNYVWTIIDHLHVSRQLLRSLGLVAARQDAREYCAKYEAASLLRNKMDHLDGNIDNLVNSKVLRPPIFGNLSYIVMAPQDIQHNPDGPTAKKCGLITVSSGSWRFGFKIDMVNPVGRNVRFPVGCFQFEAFDQKLAIEDAVRDLEPLIKAIGTTVEESVRAQATKFAEERSLPLERVLAHPGEGLILYFPMVFGSGAEEPIAEDNSLHPVAVNSGTIDSGEIGNG